MKKTIVMLLLVILGCGAAAYRWSELHSRDNVAKASSMVSRHLLAFKREPRLDLSSYLARGEDAVNELAADLLEMQSADWSGAETKREAAIEFTTRALNVIRTQTRFRKADLRLGITAQRLQEDERALAQETDPNLKALASERLQAYKDKYVQERYEYYHQEAALGMHSEMLLRANEGVKVAFGEDRGLNVTTQEFMKQLF